MKRNKEAYLNFICPYCWHRLDDCVCDLFPPHHLIFIDKNIQEHIRILNEKGYKTMYCCEGHEEDYGNTYIMFESNYFKDIDMPHDFKYNEKRRTINYSYSRKLTKEKMGEIKKENLKNLLEWCKSLPDRNAKD